MPIQNFSTERLLLSPLSENDTVFMLELVNTPGWLRFIGDRNVHSEADALAYIHKIDSLTDVHYWVAKRKSDGTSLGVVTFIKRFYLPISILVLLFCHSMQGMVMPTKLRRR